MEDKKTDLVDGNEARNDGSGGKEKRRGREKRHLGLTHSTAAKCAAFILCIVMLCVTAASVVTAVFIFANGCYWTSEESLREDTFRQLSANDNYNIIYRFENGTLDSLEDFLQYKNIGYVKIESETGLFEAYEKSIKPVDERYTYTFYWLCDASEISDDVGCIGLGTSYDPRDYPPEQITAVTVGVASELDAPDDYFWFDFLIKVMYAMLYWVYLIGIAAFIIAVVCFVFLMCSAGRRSGSERVTPTVLTRIPFEMPTLALCLTALLGFYFIGYMSVNDLSVIIGMVAWSIVIAVMFIFWCMSLALRVKLGTLLRNTLVFLLFRLILRGARFICRCIRAFVLAVPLIWKALILLAVVSAVELIAMAATDGEPDNLIIWWIIGKLVAAPIIIYFVIMLRRLERGAKEIANGNIDYKVDTKHLVLDCKKHGEELNRIRDGLNRAVEERLKSERMKTELITNVSHDIKTPLTSIINYSDLICREASENGKIREYAEVLHNQSERMKRLIEDLVEASKASSGNIDIELAECDARVLISQTSGEYCQRLADAGLELVCTAPEEEIKIMADGRRIWRVFDNLMNNARKYALAGTRVYVSLEEVGGCAVFRFRNISREALAIDAEDLTERFVRGDTSRNTEGNGLGLSIAKSLTELQGGKFNITVDGDLFKATLSFPIIRKDM